MSTNSSCAEPVSSYQVGPAFDLWAALSVIVVALVVGRTVPRLPVGLGATLVMGVTCPLLDPGFLWVEWGTSDGVPGSDIWTAVLVATAGTALLVPVRVIGEPTADAVGAAIEPFSSAG